jgi:DNA-binding transcriptional regulator YiaG
VIQIGIGLQICYFSGQNAGMTNIAAALKGEISRVARKEVREDIASIRKALSSYRSEIAALKRRVQSLEQHSRQLTKGSRKAEPVADDDAGATGKRFSAKGLISQRKRLGLSAGDCALLVGAAPQSVYNWEAGKARPRAQHLASLAAMRTMGKKEVAAKLEALKQ